jgi:hypothetical protein
MFSQCVQSPQYIYIYERIYYTRVTRIHETELHYDIGYSFHDIEVMEFHINKNFIIHNYLARKIINKCTVHRTIGGQSGWEL